MIRAILHKMLRRFESDFSYDASYMHEITDIWPGAVFRYLALSMVSRTKGPDVDIWVGALLASTLDGDCGPCAQLVADMALKSGADAGKVGACLRRDFGNAGAMGLGFRFAEAAIRDDPDVDALREELRRNHSDEALVAAAYAAASGRTYPVIKRAMGHGRACQQITLGSELHPVVRPSA